MSFAPHRCLAGIFIFASLIGCSKQEDASPAVPSQLAAPETAAVTSPEAPSMADYEKLEVEALKGDYQAKRNLSYWLYGGGGVPRSEEHTSELQSLMRISYTVLCLKKRNNMT